MTARRENESKMRQKKSEDDKAWEMDRKAESKKYLKKFLRLEVDQIEKYLKWVHLAVKLN